MPLEHILPLPAGGADSHAHLDLKYPPHEVEQVLQRAFQAGLSTIIQVFLSPEKYRTGQHKFSAHPQIAYTLGIHPTDGLEFTLQTINDMWACFTEDNRLRAIGEIGLDFYWDDCPKGLQEDVFIQQLALAKELNKPVVIHSREAAADSLRILEAEGFINRPLLWHCFGGDDALALLDRFLANGWHISVPGPVSYPKNESLRQAIARIPHERILLETDCPYLAPQIVRGKRNEPALITHTATVVAKCLNLPVEDAWLLCGNNTRRFFGLNYAG